MTSRARIVDRSEPPEPDADRRSVDPSVAFRLLAERSQDVIYRIRVAPDFAIEYVSPAVASLAGHRPDAFYRDPSLWARLIHPDDLAHIDLAALERFAVQAPAVLRWVRPDGSVVWAEHRSVPVEDAEGRIVAIEGSARDVTESVRVASERALLAAAVDQAAESIMITDADGRIAYVNAAFERSSGYDRAEVFGRNPRFLKSGVQSSTFYDAMWAALSNGIPWVADIVNRRKDGSLFTEVSVISPVRRADGVVSNYVSVSRDVTHERDLETKADLLARERQLIAETLSRIEPHGTPEATADIICRQVRNLADVSVAAIIVFEPSGTANPLAYQSGTGVSDRRRHSRERSRYLRERATTGPWVETWGSAVDHPYADDLEAAGLEAVAYAPIRDGAALIGVLAVGSSEPDGVTQLTAQLPAIAEFAALSGALVGPAVIDRHAASTVRAELDAVIAERAFAPVFQPILDLRHRRIVGYEALSRFHDGVAPDRRFADAAAIGAGLELEVATLESAIEGARGLPAGRWLSLNVSPQLISTTDHLRRILAAGPRRIILEVTEHVVVADYEAFRAGIEAIGRPVRVAVDDAGAGFASLRHILELRPAFVKLDISLVRHIDTDPAKAALVAGMRHFARATGSRLIAEGVETPGEAASLDALGIRLGQGFLLGRPASAAQLRARDELAADVPRQVGAERSRRAG